MLNRREMMIRKLLTKFHDDPTKVSNNPLGGVMTAMFGFDVHRAERTRAKHPPTYTKEEKEWVSIDKKLHTEVQRDEYYIYIYLY
jgi:hypothetical protein